MIENKSEIIEFFRKYADSLGQAVSDTPWEVVSTLAEATSDCWKNGNQLFICGNGGSAANANHIANDFLYGIAKVSGPGMRVQSLAANQAVMTCLANDAGYENIFSDQLASQGQASDLLIVLSGSGNSPNIIKVLKTANRMNITSYAIVGYTGGAAKTLADHAIHFAINDMQISEDCQLIVGHMVMQWLHKNHHGKQS